MLKMSIQSIQCWDSNSQPSEHRFPPITTKPGLPPLCRTFCPADDDDDVDDADMQSNKFIFLFSIFHVSRKTKGVSLNWLKRVLNGQEERERERERGHWTDFEILYPGSTLVDGGEGSYLPNCQTNLVIALCTLSLLLCKFLNTTAYHLSRYKPSSSSTKELHGISSVCLTMIIF